MRLNTGERLITADVTDFFEACEHPSEDGGVHRGTDSVSAIQETHVFLTSTGASMTTKEKPSRTAEEERKPSPTARAVL